VTPVTVTPPAGADPGDRREISPWGLLLLFTTLALATTGHWTLVVAVLGLGLLIFVHELGHFLAAKAFGMCVERFFIGFPPAVVRHTWGETEYGIGAIPLGGFCTIAGMTRDEKLTPDAVSRAYFSKPVWQRNLVIFAGPFMNLVAAIVIMLVFIQAGGLQQPTLTVAQIVKGTPAAETGLRAGDRLASGNGVAFRNWDQADRFIASHPGRAVRLGYRTPAGVLRVVSVKLATRPGGSRRGFLGVSPRVVSVHPSPSHAMALAVSGAARLVGLSFKGIWMLVSGRVGPIGPQGATGPVGIISVSQTAEHQSWYPLLLAFISVNLGIVNLLPILPFDGGHIFFNCLEGIRRRPVDRRVFEWASAIGTVVLVALFLIAAYNDLGRFFHLG